jgi:hypothetical protein
LARHQSRPLPQQVLNVRLRPAIDGRSPRPYLSSMARQSILGTESILSVLLCFSLLASLVLGPLCAVRCATARCAPVSVNDVPEPCHHSAARVADTSDTASAAAAVPCATNEFLFTPPRTENLFLADKSFAASSPVPPLLNVPGPASLDAPFGDSVVLEHLFHSAFSPNIPLRI